MVPLKGFVCLHFLSVSTAPHMLPKRMPAPRFFVFVFPVSTDSKLLIMVLFPSSFSSYCMFLFPLPVSFPQVQFYHTFTSLSGSLKLYSTDSLGHRNLEFWLWAQHSNKKDIDLNCMKVLDVSNMQKHLIVNFILFRS